MIVRANLHPVCRGNINKKGDKRPVTFVSSFFGKKDEDGLFVETETVSCWLPKGAATELKAGKCVDGIIDLNGEFVLVKELFINGKRYVVSENKVAELVDDTPVK